MVEESFKDWLIKRGNRGAALSYPKAIHAISEHYTTQTGARTDVYNITDQRKISEIAHDYSQSGRFSDFGYKQHSRFRAAIARYSEFFSRPRENTPPTVDPTGALVGQRTESDDPAITNFAYEKDLQSALCAHISELFPEYKIFGDNLLGVEYSIGGRRIDVLLEHRTTSDLLVVELKSERADYKTFGQLSMYIGLLQTQFPGRPVSGIVIAGAIDDSLRQAASTSQRIGLKIYRMSIELDDA